MHPHHLPSPLTSLTFLPFIILLLSPPTTSLTLTLPSPPTNLTLSPLTNLTGHSIRTCVTDPTWTPPTRPIASDCEAAVQQLEDSSPNWGPNPGHFTYARDGHSSANFSADGKDAILQLPARYVNGSCAVAIVMMKTFEEAGLQVPGLPVGKWPDSDEVGWGEIVAGGSYVRATCQNGCGYATVGRQDGVVVAIWRAYSKWDRFVRAKMLSAEGGIGVGNLASS